MPTRIPRGATRIAEFDSATASAENRTIELSFSSDAPVEMDYDGRMVLESLSHDRENVNLKRLETNAPLLMWHKRDSWPIGVIENVQIGDGKGRARVRFSKQAEGQKAFEEVQDGILTNVSVGYVRDRVVSRSERNGVESYTVAWTPLEISLVNVPADISVGTNRSEESRGYIEIPDTDSSEQRQTPPPIKESKEMAEENKAPSIDVNAVREEGLKAERKRQSEINALNETLQKKGIDVRELAEKAKAEGQSVDEFRAAAFEALPGVRKAEPLEMPKKEMRKYSLMRAIECARKETYDGLEGEIHKELLKRHSNKPANIGIIVPSDLFGVRSITAGAAGGAAELVSEDTLGLIEKLDNKPVVEMAGARRLNGLNGDVVLPKQTGGATAYWVSETADVTASDITTGVVRMTPHRLGVLTKFSNQLSAQASIGIEQMLRGDINKRINLACDLAALNGSGADGEPKGLFQFDQSNSGINTLTYSAAATYEKVNDGLATILTDNAAVSELAGIITPATWAKWASKSIDTGSGRFLWNGGLDEGTFGPGVRGYVSNQVPSNYSVFGVFSEMMLGFWESVNIIVDPYTSKASGLVELYAEVLMDIAVRHPESFCVSTDSAAQ